ncbi:photosystem II biogenesis protein Psp29 [Arthrospira platensis]|uniref:photosystem II biogenesis protein Psp29 n=1 Tax=Limnospira TaxID=2596745 RepID=UPI0007A0EF52|nr:photosystem II biogenesis protein Psp29 [Arthrospira platensis YZ]MBD2575054.1 photosystem II biogenesis protein Psp29 [Arthrospira platensis FACHB-971]MBD2671248.1 photosystem II biogenesis protein Psp29 [Arthrospira platensis FACHB-439]MBD2712142.1 photosystem II biogenesis protein Psp29 [Arthrospira platensis FACHB-835]MDT9184707.1 photosystem II biogenesis protein Psp29 [Limnospira sp. PMC 289.06]QQW30615.1 photosystem II biogenesis protein Psp29 [Arthrospira sp. PCC 9108]
MNNIRTVSDTKRAFYHIHTRPINSIYRRVVEELMVEMHLLSVNVDFKYDPIYALGVVTAFDRFMQGYTPETDKLSIWAALIGAQESDPNQYRADATALEAQVASLAVKDLTDKAKMAQESSGDDPLQSCFHAIANNPKFKYSRLLAIGLYTLLEKSDATAAQDSEGLKTILSDFSEALRLPKDKLVKDLDLYRTNLEKVAQARLMVDEMTQAERKKREQRAAQTQTAASGSKNPSKDDQVSDS